MYITWVMFFFRGVINGETRYDGKLLNMWGNNIIAFDLIGLKDLKQYVTLYTLWLTDRGIQQLRIRSCRSVKGTGG